MHGKYIINASSSHLPSLCTFCLTAHQDKMHSFGLASILLLSASCLAAPVRQHPLIHSQNPYRKDFYDPNDHKIDSIGRKLQPEPVVCAICKMTFISANVLHREMAMEQACWARATEAVRGRIQT